MLDNLKEFFDKDENLLPYSIGALLYTPADNEKLSNYILEERFGKNYTQALCLEDTIPDKELEKAEDILVNTIKELARKAKESYAYYPKIFARVRDGKSMKRIHERLKEAETEFKKSGYIERNRKKSLQDYEEGKFSITTNRLLTGYIFPKFSLETAGDFLQALMEINKDSDEKIYGMPILESKDLLDISQRGERLNGIKNQLDSVKEYILNVRVGGNDLCNYFGIRRTLKNTIYDIRCVSNILGDIVTQFTPDYVVSGPVWEYFGGEGYKEAMKKEVELDILNGFIGKTVIHPNQIEVVTDTLKISREDYLDALNILEIALEKGGGVGRSLNRVRMDEYKTHYNWALKCLIISKIYGKKY
ncbi:Citrate lyase beta subunit [Acetitomaculum ruminis DSM 5522]|uniref:Citrate lyase beta subunit n=1 Tax=Acetitomaculum ruminis DSM 5522 TaxID=1120918 RepID=A0A1I0YCU5_9FIRM|nr:HpcH/HpaI aldolase/citrate lyase family protein [Acetitomaculum ruminis]SFB10627.1 Citrate lyase beta subunit [Acetitomaculum ruminis DSM 5522]